MLFGLLLSVLAPSPQNSAPPPDSPNWEIISNDQNGEYAIDPTTIRREGTHTKVYVRARLNSSSEGPPITGVVRYAYNCEGKTFHMEYMAVYAEDGSAKGKRAIPAADQSEEAIEDNSVNVEIFDRVCT